MSWFSKLKGGDAKGDGGKDAGSETNVREHERVIGVEATVAILDHNVNVRYAVADVSEGGFRLSGYDGILKGNQYFEFRLFGSLNGENVEVDAIANVVRVKDGFLAAKFPPQPRLRTFLRDFIYQ